MANITTRKRGLRLDHVVEDVLDAARDAAATYMTMRTTLGAVGWAESTGADGTIRRSWGRLDGDRLSDDELEWVLARFDRGDARQLLHVDATSAA
jgi:hypothetical protein